LMNAKRKPCLALCYGCVNGKCIFWVNENRNQVVDVGTIPHAANSV
jgi:hypothetical protein